MAKTLDDQIQYSLKKAYGVDSDIQHFYEEKINKLLPSIEWGTTNPEHEATFMALIVFLSKTMDKMPTKNLECLGSCVLREIGPLLLLSIANGHSSSGEENA